MRVCILYDNEYSGRNDGNPLYIWNVFRSIKGCEAVHLKPFGDMSLYGKFDFYVWADWGEDALEYPGIMQYTCPSPSIYWASDTHLGYDYRLKRAREFSKVFVAQKDCVEQFKRDGIKDVSWLPHAVEPMAYPKIDIIKKYDVGFVGHINNQERADFLDRMYKEFPNFFFGRRLFEAAAREYSLSKVCLNPPIKNDINMRCFEATSAGSFLLTQDLGHNGMWDLFEPGRHFATYRTTDEAVEKAKYYIEHDDERESIALAGHEHTRKNHTFRNRVDAMLTGIYPYVSKECQKEIWTLQQMGMNKYIDMVKDENGFLSLGKGVESATAKG